MKCPSRSRVHGNEGMKNEHSTLTALSEPPQIPDPVQNLPGGDPPPPFKIMKILRRPAKYRGAGKNIKNRDLCKNHLQKIMLAPPPFRGPPPPQVVKFLVQNRSEPRHIGLNSKWRMQFRPQSGIFCNILSSSSFYPLLARLHPPSREAKSAESGATAGLFRSGAFNFGLRVEFLRTFHFGPFAFWPLFFSTPAISGPDCMSCALARQ